MLEAAWGRRAASRRRARPIARGSQHANDADLREQATSKQAAVAGGETDVVFV
jgi:hypothetical protein